MSLTVQSGTDADHTSTHSRLCSRQPVVDVVALIPAYNEARFIGSMVLATRLFVDRVIVVDDGSRDQTATIARQAGATVVCHTQNQGKATAINTGLEYIRSLKPRAVVMLDGDGQHCADDIPNIVAPILSDTADIVVGSRFMSVKNDIPLYRQIGQHGLTLATNLASGVQVSDSQSGYRALSLQALDVLHFSQGGFSIESEMQFIAQAHHLRIVEAPIKVVYAEPAKRNPLRHGLQVLDGIMRLISQNRPLLFFGMFGAISFICGFLLGLHVVQVYAQTHQLAIGYSLITVLLCMIGVMLGFTGLILHATRGTLLELRKLILARAPAVIEVEDSRWSTHRSSL